MFGGRRVARRTARRTARRVARRRMPAPAPPPPQPGAVAPPQPNYVLLAGEGSSPPIKISEQDAQKIQQQEGMSVEQLEDNDLREAMQELNIHSVPLTPQDEAALGLRPSSAPSGTVTVARPPSPPTTPQASIESQLQSLQSMKDKGYITEDDYNAKKKQILGI